MSKGIAISEDWFSSGWGGVLPRQSLYLHMAVATATVNELDGPLSALIDYVGTEMFNRHTGGLDGPIWWSFPDEEESDEEPDSEQAEIDEKMQLEFETAMAKAGRIPPQTVLQLAVLMADLGVFEHSVQGGIERWRSPEYLPLVAERLPMSADWIAEQDARRWYETHEPSAYAVIRYTMEELGSPGVVNTTLEELASSTELEVADLRFGLANLADSGFGLRAASGSASLDPETAEATEALQLVIDWDVFNEARIGIRLVVPDDEPDDE